MKVIVTCGPSYEPIDEVRRLTNFSSGQLGVGLCNGLADAGFEVFCFKGSGATHPGPRHGCHLSLFDTNEDVLELLRQAGAGHEIAAVFHVAALCDYRIRRVEDVRGRGCRSAKIASRSGALTLRLEPATKVIGQLRELFPESILVGWKYELVGRRNEALAKGFRQMKESRTEACVVNGRALGPGFAFCQQGNPPREFEDKAALVRFLPVWLEESIHGRGGLRDGSPVIRAAHGDRRLQHRNPDSRTSRSAAAYSGWARTHLETVVASIEGWRESIRCAGPGQGREISIEFGDHQLARRTRK